MGAPSTGSNDGGGSDNPVRRLARARRARAADATKDAVERAMRPTVEHLTARIDELERLIAGLRADHDAVAEDLRGLHHWLDMRFEEMERSGTLPALNKAVEGLREDVRAMDRHVRRVADRAAAPADAPAASARDSGRAPLDDLFDYDAFEREFRGDPAQIFADQMERYAGLLADCPGPVVEIGCGRGGFLAALQSRGAAVVGVEPNPDMAALARESGIEVHQQLGADYLRGVADGSLGAVVSFQVVEHLDVRDIIELVDLAVQKLAPGGLFVAETPNPASWIVLHTSFLLDPTHARPLHPALLSFLCERAGFSDIVVEYFAPAESMHLSLVTGDDVPAWAAALNEGLERLNHVLFGPQDYAVVARAPGG